MNLIETVSQLFFLSCTCTCRPLRLWVDIFSDSPLRNYFTRPYLLSLFLCHNNIYRRIILLRINGFSFCSRCHATKVFHPHLKRAKEPFQELLYVQLLLSQSNCRTAQPPHHPALGTPFPPSSPLMLQFLCSSFTFFISLQWLPIFFAVAFKFITILYSFRVLSFTL